MVIKIKNSTAKYANFLKKGCRVKGLHKLHSGLMINTLIIYGNAQKVATQYFEPV